MSQQEEVAVDNEDLLDIFVVKALRTLQNQINDAEKRNLEQNIQLVRRIKALEESNLWNLVQGKIESPPQFVEEFVVRLANGKLGLIIQRNDGSLRFEPIEEEVVEPELYWEDKPAEEVEFVYGNKSTDKIEPTEEVENGTNTTD